MQTFGNQKSNSISRDENDFDISVLKITALWAFSESAFGGILHALTVPLRGLFISSAAVLFISLISLFSKDKKDILKSTLIVILIKALVSPHSPLTAYFAVSIQGLLGYVLFLPKNGYRISAFILGILTLIFSGAQKIIILTILFGNTLWKSINVFIKDVTADFLGFNIPSDIQYGHLIIIIYISLHLLAGIFIGYYAGLLPVRVNHYWKNIPKDIFDESNIDFPEGKKNKKRKSWLLRPTGIIILIISLLLLLYTYLYPSYNKIMSLEIIIMLLRAVVLTVIWYLLLAPFFKRIFQKYISNKKSAYAQEINEIINLFPKFRKIVSYCWQNSSNKKRLSRIRYFLSTSFYYLLLIK
jgi:hypothetical protein